ncbi:MAG: hypothetical protein DME19_08765 [Verrucomicrobia bacterium]|nr:MAG: hypothetical protein DME19_08765 [Verrucomicrobiota bacterium]
MLLLLIDENLNHRILRGLLRSVPHLDYLLASDAGLKGTNDPAVLDFAARENRVLVTHDLRTIPKYAYERVKAGLPMPGVIAISDDLPIGRVIEDLAVIVECAAPSEIQLLVIYFPL